VDFGPGRDRLPTIQLSSSAMIRQRDEKSVLTFTLTSGQAVSGTVLWFDDYTVHLKQSNGAELTLFKHAVLYYSGA
jgi:RNA chaperone Hfq